MNTGHRARQPRRALAAMAVVLPLLLAPASTLAGRPGANSPPAPATTNGTDIGAFTISSHVSAKPCAIEMLPDSAYYGALLRFIRQARHRIDLTMFLFKTTASPKNRPANIMNALIRTRKRGVRINVLLEKSGYDDKLNKENQRVAGILRANKVNVRFDSPATTTHAKLVVIDERYVFVGSHNLTHSALSRNHEFSLLIDSPPLARQVIGYMEKIAP